MGKVIGVQFEKNGKLYYFDAGGFEVSSGEYVVVDTSRGYDLAQVVIGTRTADEEEWHTPLKKTIRIATEQDIRRGMDNRQKEKEAFSICQKKITEHNLEMKLVSVEYAFDNSKILFFFTANGRVDFRTLVKDLASVFKMRIELRQIGVRDEAKMLGGLGPCGRPICCGTFLDQFQPVSIKMAKEQNLSLNPTKISGVCGRLMCCLKYEQEHYELTRKRMPKIGKDVITPDGTGPVTDLNIVKETVFVRLTNGDSSEIKEYPLEEISRIQESQPRPEPVRRTVIKETESDIKKETVQKEKNPASEKNTDNSKRPAQAESEIKSAEVPDQIRDKNKAKNRRNPLGQPVKRENPNRTASPNKKSDSQHRDPNEISGREKNDEHSQSNSSPWVDALQKAMRAIEHNK